MPPFGSPFPPPQALTDPFGRSIDYARLSVTDRCDLRCTYCMAEQQSFLPKAEVLSLEELDRLASALIGLGVKKLRLTGGEPLVRKGFMTLVNKLSRHLACGALEELTLTTNGTQLKAHAADLARFGVQRINVSVDSLDPDKFRAITRGGDLAHVLTGIAAARAAGLKIKINTVALARDNLAELPALIQWAHAEGHDITLIEAMPLGETGEDRSDQYVSLKALEAEFASYWRLTPLLHRTPGPARYVRVEQTGGRLGFITPLTHNFCEACNRVRVTCTGTLFMCLGQDDQIDLRAPLRASDDDTLLIQAIRAGIARKPKGHDFDAERLDTPALKRPMAMTGG